MNDIKVSSERLLSVADELYAVWAEFAYGGLGIISAARCRELSDRILEVMDEGEVILEPCPTRRYAPWRCETSTEM